MATTEQKTRQAHRAPKLAQHRPPRTERARELVEKILDLVGDDRPSAGWEWIVWREWARSPEHARRIAEREGVRLTKIGRDLYGHRADLDALAGRNAVVTNAANDAGDDEIDPDVAAAFAGGS